MKIEDRSVRRPPQGTLDPKHLAFGKVFAPNMFLCEYKGGQWGNARLEPLHSFQLHPAALVLHYAQAIFEGQKAYRQPDGSVALFRPEQNAQRLNRSAARMCMPAFDEDLFVEALTQLTRVDEDYVVAEPGSLYLRPVMIGTEPSLGVKSASEYLFYVIALPSGAYFPSETGGPGAVEVLLSQSVVRASRGGTGAAKTAANYAVTLKVISDAKEHGCSQVLFLDDTPEQKVEEMGGMNIMFIEKGELVTPPLQETFLAGVTRSSILALAADSGIKTREYAYPLKELVPKLKDGTISEIFACGTAAVITGISALRLESGEKVMFPAPGPVAQQLYDKLIGVQYGHAPDKHSWLRQAVPAKSLV